jgi:hypothetical protein
MNRNSNRSALAALALAGGIWAWRNRDKIQSWFNRQQFGGSQSFTGETRRMSSSDMPGYDTSAPPRGIYDSPEI